MDAPDNVDILAHAGDAEDLLAFHVINYNYDIDTE